MTLQCETDLHTLDPMCGTCNLCTAVSAGNYQFDHDLFRSQELVEALMELVTTVTPFHCLPPENNKDPDIRVLDAQGRLVCRIEAKMLMDKPFMKVHDFLSGHDLYPKETIVVDLPKLMSYFERMRADNANGLAYIPTFVVWYLGRPCEGLTGVTLFQECRVLKTIFDQKGDSRVYTRRVGAGDIRNGEMMGVTRKYHFSVRECRPIEELIWELQALV